MPLRAFVDRSKTNNDDPQDRGYKVLPGHTLVAGDLATDSVYHRCWSLTGYTSVAGDLAACLPVCH